MKKPLGFWIATWFGSGLLKGKLSIGGGTWGSIFALPLCWLLVWSKKVDLHGNTSPELSHTAELILLLIVLFGFLLAGITAIPTAETKLGEKKNWQGGIVKHDHNEIVIDEVWGMLIATSPLIFIRFHSIWVCLILALLLFRSFDITKIWPANLFDRWQNPWGVMFDDGIAGIYSALCLAMFVQVLSL